MQRMVPTPGLWYGPLGEILPSDSCFLDKTFPAEPMTRVPEAFLKDIHGSVLRISAPQKICQQLQGWFIWGA